MYKPTDIFLASGTKKQLEQIGTIKPPDFLSQLRNQRNEGARGLGDFY